MKGARNAVGTVFFGIAAATLIDGVARGGAYETA